jgi:hypothetical protein
MFFRYTLTVPADTKEDAPVELYCDLTHGIITGVWVGFPRGCAGLVKLRIYRYEHQAWPTNPAEAFAWDNFVYHFEERFELYQPPYQLILRAYSPDSQHDHEIMAAFEVFTTPEPWWAGIIEGLFGRGE